MTISTDAKSFRPRLIPLIMIVVLIASLGGAWLLVRVRRTVTDRGMQIVADIRKQGPGSYWGNTQARWFVARQGGQEVGWRVDLRGVDPDRGVTGLTVVFIPGPKERETQWEWWTLDAQASNGTYRAEAGVTLQGELIYSDSIMARLDGGAISVQQQQLGGPVRQNQANVSANYLPEGTLWIAIREVAAKKTSATFEMLVNSLPQPPLATRFGAVTLEYSGTDVQGNTRVDARFDADGDTYDETFTLDSDGRVIRIEDSRREFEQVGMDKVLKSFPKVIEILKALKRQERIPLDIPGDVQSKTRKLTRDMT